MILVQTRFQLANYVLDLVKLRFNLVNYINQKIINKWLLLFSFRVFVSNVKIQKDNYV
jgi:hypothetical protein